MSEETVIDQPPVRNFGYMENDFDTIDEPEISEPEIKPPVEEKKPEVKTETKPDTKPDELKPEIKPEVKVETKPEEKPAEVTPTDWKAALKTADKYEALKELGYDDFTIDLLKYKELKGDLTPYLEVKTVDYKKMTPEQLFKIDLQKQNPGMSEKALNFKFNKEFSEKYYLNREDWPEGSVEAEYGQEQLRIDAEQKRKAFIEEQDKFRAPEPKPDLDATKKEADLQQQKATLSNLVMNNEATTSLQKAKGIVFGEGEESFTYPIENAQALVDTALNTILNSGMKDLTGVDMQAFYRNLAKGQPGWEKAYADHITAVAKDKFQKELQNITPPEGETPKPELVKKDYGYKTR